MNRKAGLAILLCMLAVPPVMGQEWASKMFKVTRHDFGTLARGAKAEFEFELNNIYLEDVHIAGVRSSCGCTSVRCEKPDLKTYETSAVIASVNTRAFLGQKGATITVTLDKPFPAEVQLQVSSYIRSDVVFEPGVVQLGSLALGQPAEAKVSVNYAGRGDWKVLEVRSANPHLSGELVETSRGIGQVNYELRVRLDGSAPIGYINDHLVLVTDDYQSTQIPLKVEGRVLSSITVSPASLFMGVVQPGQKVTKQLVVKGAKPFRILAIRCEDKCFEFDTSSESAPKELHLIPVTFAAGHDPGKIAQTIRIETDLGDGAPELSAFAVVTPPKATATP
ncbi:MAG: DUF1573 domain-containing protein [Planctomycetota bacterium]